MPAGERDGRFPSYLLTSTAHTYTNTKPTLMLAPSLARRLVCRGSMIHFSMIVIYGVTEVCAKCLGGWAGPKIFERFYNERACEWHYGVNPVIRPKANPLIPPLPLDIHSSYIHKHKTNTDACSFTGAPGPKGTVVHL